MMTSASSQPRPVGESKPALSAVVHTLNNNTQAPPLRLRARLDTCYSVDWTAEEQVALDATLDKYPVARHTPLERYLRAKVVLPKKSARDVALRVKWLATSSATKRRINEENAAKKRPRIQSIFAVQPVKPQGIPAGLSAPGANFPRADLSGLDDHTSSALGMVGGPMGSLLEQNYLILNQYKQNMQHYKVHENTELLCRIRDNIVSILSQMNSMSGLMQKMPPLPVSLNFELARDFLPPTGSAGNFGNPIPGAGAFRTADNGAKPVMKIAPTVPVTNNVPIMQTSSKPGSKSNSAQAKPKSAPKKANSVRSEERSIKSKNDNLRTSARKAAQNQKGQPARSSEVRTSARLAAASDSGNS